MALSARERKALLGASHRLKPVVTLAAGELSEAAVQQVRAAFTGRPLVKLRVNTDGAAECDALAEQLAARVPCEIVRRVGHVLVLYRPRAGGGAGGLSPRDAIH